MKKSIETLAKKAAKGERHEALAWWREALKQRDPTHALQAATLLGYTTQVDDWLQALWEENDWEVCSELFGHLGLQMSPEVLKELDTTLSQANGRRTSSNMAVPSLLSFLFKCATNPGETFFLSSYATEAGSTVLLGGTIGKKRAISVSYHQPGCELLQEGDEEWERNVPIPTTPAKVWPEAFEGWEDMSKDERHKAFGKWANNRQGVFRYSVTTPTFPVDQGENALTPGSDVLSEQENAVLAKVLALQEQGELSWLQLMNIVDPSPEVEPISEMGLALLNRMIDIPDIERSGTGIFETSRDEAHHPTPWIHLARFFVLPSELTEKDRALLNNGGLRHAKIIHINTETAPPVITEALHPKNKLDNVRKMSFLFNAALAHKEWSELPSFDVWRQLSALSWGCCTEPKRNRKDGVSLKNPIDGANELLVKLLPHMENLHRLDLRGTEIDEEIATTLVALPSLRTLTFTYCCFAPKAEKILAKSLPKELESLTLEWTHLPKGFGTKTKNRSLRQLQVSNPSRHEEMYDFCTAPCFSQLEMCSVDGLHNGLLLGLASHTGSSTLKSLYLKGDTDLKKEGIHALFQSGAFQSLEEFRFEVRPNYSRASIISRLFKQAMGSAHLPSLVHCHFSGPGFGDDVLAKALQQTCPPKLQNLTLPDISPFNASMGKIVADWPGLQQLKYLSLANCTGTIYKRAIETIKASALCSEELELVLNE